VRDSTLAVLEDSLYVTGQPGLVTNNALVQWDGTSGTAITGTGVTLAELRSEMKDTVLAVTGSSIDFTSVQLDSSILDSAYQFTLYGYTNRAYSLDTLIVTFRGDTINLWLHIFHSSGDSLWADSTNIVGNTSPLKYSTFNDKTIQAKHPIWGRICRVAVIPKYSVMIQAREVQ